MKHHLTIQPEGLQPGPSRRRAVTCSVLTDDVCFWATAKVNPTADMGREAAICRPKGKRRL
jgi:hypothetical protein